MKIKELELGQEVFINGYKYAYKGVQKVLLSKMIVFENEEFGYTKHFDLIVEKKVLKETNGKLKFDI